LLGSKTWSSRRSFWNLVQRLFKNSSKSYVSTREPTEQENPSLPPILWVRVWHRWTNWTPTCSKLWMEDLKNYAIPTSRLARPHFENCQDLSQLVESWCLKWILSLSHSAMCRTPFQAHYFSLLRLVLDQSRNPNLVKLNPRFVFSCNLVFFFAEFLEQADKKSSGAF